ncbi:hypothetical protein GK047_08070 [Paenibacillus sp. SYP-B3998]|uniref:Uncharacterized protein n=1 Tax=Paenibacillus sp. SYP-B3998 TaxID=2678564 RepID=A0A6G3ZUZ3_9BACL|nr:hypothetical protein [Paenibacillus sp. SYP-B3998]NEW05962.1 hypothetical protein [Paenibacillus sp. SYP-B3998]
MFEEKNESKNNKVLNAEIANENISCRDLTLVADNQFSQNEQVELVDKEEYIDEP